jgi:hypothetical protein
MLLNSSKSSTRGSLKLIPCGTTTALFPHPRCCCSITLGNPKHPPPKKKEKAKKKKNPGPKTLNTGEKETQV